MKKIIFSIALTLHISALIFAQAPQKFSYQAVIRNASNQLIGNQIVGLKVSIIQGSPSGNSVFSELHAPLTNSNGLISIEIGGGSPINGNINSIDWANGPFFIQTETDIDGGNNYTITAISQLMSVPYALYALNSGSNIPGPQGAQGPQGLAGPAGPQGPIGLTGATGQQGPIGLTGPTGATGPQGPIGLTGATGVTGQQGPIGLTGPAGATGPQGPIGLTGATGPQGPIGLTGPAGATGTQGPIGLTGAPGPQGGQGLIGATGPQGPPGPQLPGSFEHFIGEQFEGGVVFHLWKDSAGEEHGLIVDLVDLSISQQWSNIISASVGPNAQSTWDGLSNSIAIVNQAGHVNSAALLCLNNSNGGQNDWYLPAIDELEILYNNRMVVNSTLRSISGGSELKKLNENLIFIVYWSSTELLENNAWEYFFATGTADYFYGDYGKSSLNYVRSVRRF